MSERRKFSNEFKREAVELARSANVTVSQVARELGVNATLLSKWRRQLEREGEKAFPADVPLSERITQRLLRMA